MITVPTTWIPAPPDQTAHREPCPFARNFRVYHWEPDDSPGTTARVIFSVSGRPHDFAAMKAAGYRSFLTWETEKDTPHLQARAEAAGLRFFRIPVKDEHAPDEGQAETFLGAVGDPENHPLHTACAAGEHRSNLGACLVRVTFDRRTVAAALAEAESFNVSHFGIPASWIRLWEGGPLSPDQAAFLAKWAVAPPPSAWRVG